jgi:agmatinase
LRYQFLPNEKLKNSDIVIQPIPFGESISAKSGTHKAPKAILKASETIEYFDEELNFSPMKYVKLHIAKSIKNYEKITKKIKKLNIRKNQLFIALGGDHSITHQISKALLKEKTTIVFLDAHGDLRQSYLGNPNSHATPAWHLLNQGHSLFMIGIRSLFEKEAKLIDSNKNITTFFAKNLRKKKEKNNLLKAIRKLKGDVYISIDMDVFDPAFVPGVGTPQAGGIDYYLAIDILKELFFNKNINIKGVDFVELIPDKYLTSQTFCAKLLQKVISFWTKANGFDKNPPQGTQTKVEYE